MSPSLTHIRGVTEFCGQIQDPSLTHVQGVTEFCGQIPRPLPYTRPGRYRILWANPRPIPYTRPGRYRILWANPRPLPYTRPGHYLILWANPRPLPYNRIRVGGVPLHIGGVTLCVREFHFASVELLTRKKRLWCAKKKKKVLMQAPKLKDSAPLWLRLPVRSPARPCCHVVRGSARGRAAVHSESPNMRRA